MMKKTIAEMDYRVDESRVIDLLGRLDFPRVVGTAGEQRGYNVIWQELAALRIKAGFEESPSPWVEIAEADLRIQKECWPITPLVSPLFNGRWIPIPEEVDIEGILVDSIGSDMDTGCPILLRDAPDIASPCVPGAAAQLFACQPDVGFVAYYLAAVGSLGKPLPSAWIAPEIGATLRQRLGRTCRFRWASVKSEKVLRNLVAEIRGIERPEQVIAIGAHIDSFPGTVGADDNASGCARLVELARWFVAHPPLRTLRFIWFTGEELDRRGSRAYVQAHAQDEDRICLFINVDSGCDIEHERLPVEIENPLALKKVVDTSLGAVCSPEGGLPFRKLNHCSEASDAEPFHEAGIPAIYAPGTGKRKKGWPSAHLPTDIVGKLNRENVRTATMVALAFIDAAQNHGLTIHST